MPCPWVSKWAEKRHKACPVSPNGDLPSGLCPFAWTPSCTLSHKEGTKDSPTPRRRGWNSALCHIPHQQLLTFIECLLCAKIGMPSVCLIHTSTLS